MNSRRHPEADIQRQIVRALRAILPAGSIVHHCANEVRGGAEAQRRQAILQGMGVHPGVADLLVLAQGRVLFLEVKGPRGRLSEAQRQFAYDVRAQGFGWALVRSLDDALEALKAHGIATRVRARR